MNVALIERKRFGGTCVNTGCIPTKALVASAHAAHIARRGGEFGVYIGATVSVDMARVKARKDKVVHDARDGVETWLKGMQRCTVIQGHARSNLQPRFKSATSCYRRGASSSMSGGAPWSQTCRVPTAFTP